MQEIVSYIEKIQGNNGISKSINNSSFLAKTDKR